MLWNRLGATLANSNQPARALDAYTNSLEINSACIRARYNIAVSCIQLGSYKEAAEHLLGALSIQEGHMEQVMQEGKGKSPVVGIVSQLHQLSSDGVWNALRMLFELHSKFFMRNVLLLELVLIF
jgi:peroxin-5